MIIINLKGFKRTLQCNTEYFYSVALFLVQNNKSVHYRNIIETYFRVQEMGDMGDESDEEMFEDMEEVEASRAVVRPGYRKLMDEIVGK